MIITATIRGYTITGTATLDHYAISVDGQPTANAGTGHYTFETKGNHTIAVSAIWHGTAVITGPDLPARPSRRRSRQRDDHLDAELPRQRDPLGPPALNRRARLWAQVRGR